ncbi:lipoate--protein ligase family protein [Sporosarcina limicola]|uniref:Octanoyl-[GcvH]:protein N-octanoyltransferase n=1 Tax=Sporosarcina limicola TaxID=34101 RepID=A0A927MMS3_9BACL|nr:lipoate--protein ligase family protein [Sporosarcina limicola]MBE1555762.1 octanoyl-[GcvH]:protein N-octanoyltransferase [Sporosarcina limicola]
MSQYESFLRIPEWRFVDESNTARTRSALESFAMDDTLCHLVGQQMSVPTIRSWVHNRTVVLGIQDHRLPHIDEAIPMLEKVGYQAIVRNSGGLAVVLDEGVLNLSIVLSEHDSSIDIPAGYEVMLSFVRMLFPEVGDQIEAYEIVGSYCPGSYDLSIGGRKFAGISQRRLRQGIAVQVYLCVEGSGAERATLIRDLYEIGLQGDETKFAYPAIKPDVMASLAELLEMPIIVSDVVIRAQLLLRSLADNIVMGGLNPEEMELYMFYLNRVVERNKKMLARE